MRLGLPTRRLQLQAAALLAVCVLTAAPQKRHNVQSGRFTQVVLFGDSLSWSMRAPYGRRYADCLEAALQRGFGSRTCVDVAACGAGGNTARGALPRIRRDVLEYEPDVVVLNFGANDAGREEKAGFESSYRRILQLLREKTDALVVCETIPVLDEEWHAYRDREAAKAAGGLNRHLEAFSHSFVRRVAAERGLTVHDRFRIYHDALAGDASLRAGLIRRDGVHLTEAGNAYFADSLAGLIVARLAERARSPRDRSGDWLGKAAGNPALRRVLAAAGAPGTLETELLRDEQTTRLELQQARSLARRAAVCTAADEERRIATRLEALAAALMAARRVLRPALPVAGSGSREWALEQLAGLDDVPEGLRQVLAHQPGVGE